VSGFDFNLGQKEKENKFWPWKEKLLVMSKALLTKIPITHPKSWRVLSSLFYNVIQEGVFFSHTNTNYNNFHTRILLNDDLKTGILTCHPMTKDLSRVFVVGTNNKLNIEKRTQGSKLSQDIFDCLVFHGTYDHYHRGVMTNSFCTITVQEIKDAVEDFKVSKLI